MRKQSYREFTEQLDKQEKMMVDVFLLAVQSLRSQARRDLLEAAIAARNTQQILVVLNLNEWILAPLDAQIEEAFRSGAIWQLDQIPGRVGGRALNLRVGFDHRNIRAEKWVRDRGSRLISEMLRDQQNVVREAILGATESGWGVERTRRALIGTKRGNVRKGGLIGLHSKDSSAVSRMKAYLSDPSQMAEYFQRSARNKTYDRTVRKAIREGNALNTAQIDRIASAYADRLLVKRADRIARTEMHNAFTAGANEGIRQLIESGKVPADAITLEWQATVGSPRTRDSHRSMHGMKVRYGEAFTSPLTGAQLRFPGDSDLGAPAEETINCRCAVRPTINFARLAR